MVLIAMLNAIDGIATFLGLKFVLIEEKNPLMMHLWEMHPLIFLLYKLGLSVGVFLLLRQKVFQQKKWERSMGYVQVLYAMITVLHVRWIWIYINMGY